jgi:O-antigen/teichoic acid export membrane protein
VNIFTEAATACVGVALAFFLHSLPAVLLNMAFWTAVSACLSAFLLKRAAVQSLVLRPLLSRAVLDESAGYAGYIWLQAVTNMVHANFDRFLIASQIGTEALAYYAISLQLAQQIHTFLSRAFGFLFPLFSEMCEWGMPARVRYVYVRAFIASIGLALAIAVPLYLAGPDILRLWVGKDVAAESSDIFRILVCYSAILATTIVPHYFLNGVGDARLNALFSMVSVAVAAVATVVLVPRFGAGGAALARVTIAPVCAIFFGLIHHRLGLSVRWVVAPSAVATLAFISLTAWH